ncbi:dioxygenase family protein [Ekhidna sp.]
MKEFIVSTIFSFILYGCHSQTNNQKIVGGPCEGCEALLEYEEESLNSTDTLPGFQPNGPKVHLYGTVFHNNGKTPAKDVIVYIYHTNREGIYETTGKEKGWGKRHGFIRGWIKTGENGRYDFYTFKPASYPNTTISQHIHMTVKESDTNPYYIDNVIFTDDPLLTRSEIENQKNRGGSGVTTPKKESESALVKVKRDIILGKNIPDY